MLLLLVRAAEAHSAALPHVHTSDPLVPAVLAAWVLGAAAFLWHAWRHVDEPAA